MKKAILAVLFTINSLGALSASAGPIACPAWGCGPAPIHPILPILPIDPLPPICAEPEFVCPVNADCAVPPPCVRFAVPLEHGVWASAEARMTVDASGATIEFGCASGQIKGQIFLLNGSFSRMGTLQSDLGVIEVGPNGPIYPKPKPALFTGVVRGDVLDLTVEGQTYVLDFGSNKSPYFCE